VNAPQFSWFDFERHFTIFGRANRDRSFARRFVVDIDPRKDQYVGKSKTRLRCVAINSR
jgi:hypothetical protein